MVEQSSSTVTFTKLSDVEYAMTRVFDAPRELVFAVYTDPEHIPHWWGPRSVTTVVDEMDVRPGGRWRYVHRDPDGTEYGFRGEYREIMPPERIVSTFEFEGMPGHVVVETATFTEENGRTRLTATSLFESAADFEGMIASGAESGAIETWERLAELLDRLSRESAKKRPFVQTHRGSAGRSRRPPDTGQSACLTRLRSTSIARGELAMQRRSFVSTLAAAGAYHAAARGLRAQSGPGTATPTDARDVRTGYAPVNGLEMYYEIHGSGEPLVLLHGAFASIDLWGPMLSGLAENHQVIAVEFEAHGHTANIGRPFRYEQLADDVAGVMEHLEITQADIVGYSLGGNTGLQLAVRHPDLVRKLVAISATYRSDGTHAEIVAVAQTLSPEAFAGSPPEQAYLSVAPNPEDWPALIEKVAELETFEWAWPESDIRAISAPTLLIVADSDSVRVDHAAELFELLGGNVPGDLTGLPNSQLAILPGASHLSIVLERVPELVPMIDRFLAAPMPEGQ